MSDRFIAYPFALGPRLARMDVAQQREGIAETPDPDAHLRAKIVAILFTAPGERVMRPGFGAGLSRSVFENLSPLARMAVEYRVRETLDRDLGPEAILEDVEVRFDSPEGAVLIAIDYTRRADRSQNRLEIVL
ncbi:GPW/gp25 family protein [Sedimentitalea sp. JM2-8]|uniref:GPW/gp25 family protein n=1 Tax=Sedimentitalea xiamensis TaxID=3050037 RepID=A0ABT7FEJ5_9RHOB|nr:GPW/gp25 family protein [Sedimentitalea xiamensis]MDK3073540.1 GPW/gp25 family protein [Sedimentitalea xiamensis]